MATASHTTTYSQTTARYVASKVAADLHQLSLFYGRPRPAEIEEYVKELVILLPRRFISSVDYGFQVGNTWVAALRYVAQPDGTLTADARAGGVPANMTVNGRSWHSFLRYSEAWSRLSNDERGLIEATLPFKRVEAPEPDTGAAVWVEDKSYSREGLGLSRKVLRQP